MVSSVVKRSMNLLYEGSVKLLWQNSHCPENIYFEFTDDYSIFDWGKMPDKIANKGLSLTLMGAYFFEKLSSSDFWQKLKNDNRLNGIDSTWLKERFQSDHYRELEEYGLQHHYKGLFNQSNTIKLANLTSLEQSEKLYLEVLKADVLPPHKQKIDGKEIYFYPPESKSKSGIRLIPLEVVFRFGMPQGSSLAKRLAKNPHYYKELGLKTPPKEGDLFERPVIEFFTKLEASDRFLSFQEAQEISRLEPPAFEDMVEQTYAIALSLFSLFKAKNITLFDGKFEFILNEQIADRPQVMLADSIGPDELRLIYKGHHLSKELLRQYYINSDWASALANSKEQTKLNPSISFKEHCLSELKQEPQTIKPEDKIIIDQLYPVLTNTITEKTYFDNAPDLDKLVSQLSKMIEGLS